MAILTVGVGGQYSTIAAAVAASKSGDTVQVQAGTYTDDFVTISHNLTLTAVGGTVYMNATRSPPNGKAIIDEGGSGVSVTISGFDISGAAVSANNGSAVRYEGGNLTLNNVNFHDNQEGLLTAADPNGNIMISNSVFSNNGANDGYTHNIYVGAIRSLTVQNSTITGAKGGHEIKSRAAANTIVGNTIGNGTTGNGSYLIDLPNGGVAVIQGNVLEKGPAATNGVGITYGEEGLTKTSNSLSVRGNVIVNEKSGATSIAVRNSASTVTALIANNDFYGWKTLYSGNAAASGNVTLASEPDLGSLVPSGTTTPNPIPMAAAPRSMISTQTVSPAQTASFLSSGTTDAGASKAATASALPSLAASYPSAVYPAYAATTPVGPAAATLAYAGASAADLILPSTGAGHMAVFPA